MFSDGTVVVAEGKDFRKANKNEVQSFLRTASNGQVQKYLSGIFPQEKEGKPLTHVRLDRETGYAYGKYANTSKLTRKRVLAQSAPANQTEPTDSGKRTDEHKGESETFETPRNEKKSKPQEFKGRDDVNKPKEVRDGSYEKGQGGKCLHTDVVPRDKSGDGVGGESTTFSDEKTEGHESSNPDKYVQEWKKSEEPEAAGSEKNHAVAENKKALDVKFAGDDLRFKFAKDSDDKDHSDEEKDGKPKKSKMPPWLNKDKDGSDDEKASEKDKDKETKAEVVELRQKLASNQKQLQKLEREISNRKIAEARKEAAIGLVLAYRDRQPEKYASAEAFAERVTEIAKKMSVEAIDNAMEEFNSLVLAEADRQKKTAQSADTLKLKGGSLSHPVIIPQQNYKFASDFRDSDDLASILMQNTSLGKSVSDMTRYHEQINDYTLKN